MDIETTLKILLPGFDEDIFQYIVAIFTEMTDEEKKNIGVLSEAIGPFILSTDYGNEADISSLCQKISVSFGGSGYKSNASIPSKDDSPELLNKPVRINDNSIYQPPKATYGGVVIGNSTDLIANTAYNVGDVPTTLKDRKRINARNEEMLRKLELEAAKEAMMRQEMAIARMAAIRASRISGKSLANGVKLDRFRIPHPSGTGDLMTDISLTLLSERRYGLIGLNGAGKSTLLRWIAGYKLEGLSNLKIMLVDQHVEGDEETPMQWLLRADVERTSLLEEEIRLSNLLHEGDLQDADIPPDLVGVNLEIALQECYERMDAIGVSSAEARAGRILNGLGFDEDMLNKPTNSLSGGWAMRASLASAIFVKPDLLLLDEPTNHLDLHALVWLELWLNEYYRGICVIVSHDTHFLDCVCTDILELRSKAAGQSRTQITQYSGDYTSYFKTLKEKNKAIVRQKHALELQKAKLKDFVTKEGGKYDGPAYQGQKKSKLKKLENLEDIEDVEEDIHVTMHFPKPNGVFAKDETLIGVHSASFGWIDGQNLFENVDFVVSPKARFAIMGKNGCGKTCLLNVLLGDMNPTSGSVTRHVGVRISLLQQHHYRGEQLDPDLSPMEHIRMLVHESSAPVGGQKSTEEEGRPEKNSRQEETFLRAYLANFGIQGARATIPVRYLSGGQRMRVAIAVALHSKPDILMLDEPTNHLDEETVAALGDALQTFEGAVIAVSHDEGFIQRLIYGDRNLEQLSLSSIDNSENGVHEIWIMSKQRLQRYNGSFSDYKALIRKSIKIENMNSFQ